MTKYIMDFYPLKAQYRKGEPVETALELVNTGVGAGCFECRLEVYRLAELEESFRQDITLEPGESRTLFFRIPPREVDFEGYGADLKLWVDGLETEGCSTSFDVVSSWRKAPRYCFLSDFNLIDAGDNGDVENLSRFHFNLVQFYDWMYRHDDLVPPAPEFTDLMGRKLNLDVVREKIGFCHDHGMKAVAYGAVYAASREFYAKHPQWGLYSSSGEVYDFIDIFKIMNIAPDSPWHEHIIGEYAKALDIVGFDGIHMDTYGFPKTGISVLDGKEKPERLELLFPALINDTREKLEQVREDVCLIFNNVGNWPVDTVACAAQDALYIEVWEPYERYHHIREILQWARYLGKGKPVILAAYLKPFRVPDDEDGQGAQYSALLLTSVIAANGGSHLLLGEYNGILTQGYYADYSRLDGVFARRLRDYYDFIVRYSTVLYDTEARDVTMTHCGGDNPEYVFENAGITTYGESGKVWAVIREKPERKVISLINLTNNGEDFWNRSKKEPLPQKGMAVSVLVQKEPRQVFWASPDTGSGRASLLKYSLEDSKRGKTVKLELPELRVWSLLVMEF